METRASYLLVGSFVLALIAGLVVFVMWAAKVQLEKTSDIYFIYFTGSVTGLQEGSPVRYAGVAVGTVKDIRIDPDNVQRVRVTVEVQEDTPIKADSVASLEMQGLTGLAYVQISAGTHSSERLSGEDGDFPVIPSRPSTFATVVDAAPAVLNRTLEVTDRLVGFLTAENQRAFSEILINIQTVTRELAANRSDIGGTLAEIRALSAELRHASETLTKSADATFAQTRKTLASLDGDAREMTGELVELSKSLRRTSDQLGNLVKENREPVRAFTSTGLYELSLVIAETRDLVSSLQRVASRIERDPSEVLFGGANRGQEIRR